MLAAKKHDNASAGSSSRCPLAIERDGPGVVHSCWYDEMIELVRPTDDAAASFWSHYVKIEVEYEASGLDDVEQWWHIKTATRVKVLTSGLEQRIEGPFEAGGKVRHQERVRWWKEYEGEPLCVIGHYALHRDERSFSFRAICAEFAVDKGWREQNGAIFRRYFPDGAGCGAPPRNSSSTTTETSSR